MYTEKTYTQAEALAKIQHYCAIQERAHSDVESKLYDYGLNRDEIDEILINLISNNFLNEERFAEAFVSGKFNIKKWGKIKIKSHLKQKRVSDRNINKALEQITQEEYTNTLTALIEKKSNLLGPIPMLEKKVKLVRFVSSKGYESSLTFEFVNDHLGTK